MLKSQTTKYRSKISGENMPKQKTIFECVYCNDRFDTEEEAKNHESECSDNPVFNTRIAVDIKVDKYSICCNKECPLLMAKNRGCALFGKLSSGGVSTDNGWSSYSRHINCIDAQATWMEASTTYLNRG